MMEFLFLQPLIPFSLNFFTAYPALSMQHSINPFIFPSLTNFNSYHKKRGDTPFRDPEIVLSAEPIYSTFLPISSKWTFLVKTHPHGKGVPIILCPLIAMLSMSNLKSKGCDSNSGKKGRIDPKKAASQWI